MHRMLSSEEGTIFYIFAEKYLASIMQHLHIINFPGHIGKIEFTKVPGEQMKVEPISILGALPRILCKL